MDRGIDMPQSKAAHFDASSAAGAWRAGRQWTLRFCVVEGVGMRHFANSSSGRVPSDETKTWITLEQDGWPDITYLSLNLSLQLSDTRHTLFSGTKLLVRGSFFNT
jgi:hypothetical protein